MPSDDRERSFGNALARHLRPGVSVGGCSDAETLAAYHEESLAPEAMASLKAHVSECGRCQQILAQLQATDEIPMAAANMVHPQAAATKSAVRTVPPRKPTLWRWIAPAGALAAGLLVWLTVRENNPVRFATPHGHDAKATEIAKAQPSSAPSPPASSLDATRKSEVPSPDAYSTSTVEPRLQSRSSAEANREIGVPGAAAIQRLQSLNKEKENKEKDLQSARKKSSAAVGVAGGSAEGAARFVTPSAKQPDPQPAPPRGVTESVAVEAAPEATNQVTGADLARTASEAKSADDKRDTASSRSATPTSAVGGAEPAPAAPAPQSYSQTVEVTTESSAISNLPVQNRAVTNLATLNPGAQLLLASGSAAVTVSAPGGRPSWRVGPAGVILFSPDAGKTWLVQPSGIITDLLAGSAPSNKVCWIVGRGGTILRTTDKGKHWRKVQPPTQDDFVSVFAVNARQAIVSPASGTYQTTDGGATWNKLPPR